jgi:putative DNA primase/helicase
VSSTPNFDRLPADLKALRRWVTWRHEIRKGKRTKRPLQSIRDSCDWLSLSEARHFISDGRADGVGFVLGDGLVGIDLDACIEADCTVHEIARDALALDSYMERSPGGRGFHLLIRATIEKPRKIGARGEVPGREVYDGRTGSSRYFTVTGERVGSATQIADGPQAQAALDAFMAKWFRDEVKHVELSGDSAVEDDMLDDDRVTQLMFEANDGAKWRAIFGGDHSGYASQSEADLALCRKLRFYSRANAAQINRLFRRSGLMRPKWNEKHGAETYGDGTINKAIALGGRVYSGRRARYSGAVSSGQFGMVHRSVLPFLASLAPTDVLIYVALAVHADEGGLCHPSAAALARLAGTTREHAQNSISSLAAAGLVFVEARLGKTSIFRLPAFGGVSKFDTGREAQPSAGNPTKPTRIGRRPKPARRIRPVSDLDTPPVSNFDTQTNKEQSVDTGERRAGTSENHEAKVAVLPNPTVRLRRSARLLRDDMLRGPVGQFFIKGDPSQPTLAFEANLNDRAPSGG